MGTEAMLAHYDAHLGETYVWMCGGMDAALRAGREEIVAWGLPARRHDLVLDLGCGFGKHAIPLAAAGARVHAIDASAAMLDVMRAHLPPLADVRIRCADIVDELARTPLRADAILCLGDTLTHLPAPGAVERMLRLCAERIAPGGRIALAFRDYSSWHLGERRRFEVRSGFDRRVDCTVTVLRDHVAVEDAVCEQVAGAWKARWHQYRKLRLEPGAVEDMLVHAGLHVDQLPGLDGMTRLLARAA